MFASTCSFTKNDPLCMAYHPYHFVGEVLLHPVGYILHLEIETTVQGGDLGLGDSWRAVCQLAIKLPLSSQSSCICRMGRKVGEC